jgi:hypothetical protein
MDGRQGEGDHGGKDERAHVRLLRVGLAIVHPVRVR